MTTETATPQDQRVSRTLPQLVREADRFRLIVGAIVLCQLVWLGALMSRGWYYQADLANLAEATGKPLSWSYVSAPQGGHFGAPIRFVFWVLNRTAPLNYTLTIGLRLLGQAVATVLLARLLALLVGRRPIVLVTVTLYAFSPFLIQGTLWVSSAFGLIASQLLVLGALTNHVHYALSRQFSRALAVAACVLGAALLSEQAAVTVLALPILSLVFLSAGSAKHRLRETLSCWPEWLLIAVPVLAYVVYYFTGFTGSGGYGAAAHPLSASSAARVVGIEWRHTIAPGLIGGPWRWFSARDNYLGIASPSPTTQALCLLAVIMLVLVSFRAQGWRALVAWSMPAVIAAVGIVIVAIGRYHVFGVLIAEQFEHAYYTAVPAALAVCLGLCRVDIGSVRARLSGRTAEMAPIGGRRRRSRRGRLAIASSVTALMVSSIVSGLSYAQLWSRSPARDYVTNLERSLRAAGPNVPLYDTAVPTKIIPLESTHFVSDVVGLTRAHADFGYAAPAPRIVDGKGNIASARFYVQTDVDLSGPGFCLFPVQGATTVTRSLRAGQRPNDWYLQISYFEQHASVVRVSVIDKDGHERLPATGDREVLRSGPGGLHLLFRDSDPVAVQIQAGSPATNLCITAARIGFPYAVTKAAS